MEVIPEFDSEVQEKDGPKRHSCLHLEGFSIDGSVVSFGVNFSLLLHGKSCLHSLYARLLEKFEPLFYIDTVPLAGFLH